jgi:hypothetical protein
MKCTECSGSGACDGCDGYGCYPDSYPNAGDGPDCDICDGSGICAGCGGTGDTESDTDMSDTDMSGIDTEMSVR